MPLIRRAYAKLNLALSVGRPEPPGSPTSGMHPIASWIHSLDLFDTVELSLSESPIFENRWAPNALRPTPIDWPAERDLAFRALRLLEQSTGRRLPVSIRIDKRIPAGGGLGGGSSDAAAVFMGVNELCSLGLSRDALAQLSAALGSDIAYFIDDAPASPPRPALVRGMGDQIERLPRTCAGREVVLIFPAFGCPTGPVYKAYDALGPRPLREAAVRALAGSGDVSAAPLFNDLLTPAQTVQPALAPLCDAVHRAGALPVHMSGSGSTLFLLPPSEAGPLAAKIRTEVADISVLVARLI